jgi:archaemetzincin
VSTELYLAPLKFSNTGLIRTIKTTVENYFHREVKILHLDMDVESAYSAERSQYYSTKLIAQAIPLCQEINGKIILLADFDLYIPIFTFLFGEAMLNGKLSIVSLCRLHEEFYTGNTDEVVLIERAMKEILHELGHNFGLYHCENWDCVMHSSAGIEEVDIKGGSYCRECVKSIT